MAYRVYGERIHLLLYLGVVDENDEERWNNIIEKFKSVNYKTLKEKEDTTEVQETIACGGGACEIPGLPEMVPASQPETETA